MEDFVQSSGDNGIVVFSLGSMVKNLTKDRANTIASALGQIPQKVRIHTMKTAHLIAQGFYVPRSTFGRVTEISLHPLSIPLNVCRVVGGIKPKPGNLGHKTA